MINKIQLLHVFATFDPGGPQVRITKIINALPKYFHHTIIAVDKKKGAMSLIKKDINVTYIDIEANTSFFYILRLIKTIYFLSPNLILTYNWGAIDAVLAALICHSKKVLHMEAGFRPDEAGCSQKKRRILYRRFLLRQVSGVIVPSLNLRNIAKSIWKIPNKKIFYIPNGVDCDQFSPGKAIQKRRKLGIGDDECVIGIVAHLREVKNISFLIRTFASIKKKFSIHILIIGDGMERAKLASLAEKLDVKDNVHFLGHQEDPSECYKMMDIFALSSKTEQMPVSVLEAMASELPILSTDVGDIKKMVDIENHDFIVPLKNEYLYREALEKLVINKDLRTYLGKKNREKCLREYQHTKMISSYYNLYKKVLSLY